MGGKISRNICRDIAT